MNTISRIIIVFCDIALVVGGVLLLVNSEPLLFDTLSIARITQVDPFFVSVTGLIMMTFGAMAIKEAYK